MGIAFHCTHCGKKIEAPDGAGGKWGKCPACHNRVYIPNMDPDEDLKLAPIDESEEVKQKQLMAETYKLTQDILLEKEAPAESAGASASSSAVSDKELTKQIIIYLRLMADGQLDQVQEALDVIVNNGRKALKIIDEIALSEIPEPELDDIAPQVLAGMIRDLRAKIS